MLSPHLHFGELSVNQIWYAAKGSKQGNMDDPGLDCYLSELGERVFTICYFIFPNYQFKLSAKFDQFPWLKDEQTLKAWQRSTGYPIVDAGMEAI